MSEAKSAEVPDALSAQPKTAAATPRPNPWGVALLVLAGAFFVAASIAWAYGNASAEATFDNSTGPRHDQLALYQHVTAVTLAGFGALLVVLRIAVEAVRWDPAER